MGKGMLLVDVGRRLGCGQKEMERDKNQNFPTVILSFLMGEHEKYRERTVTIFDYSFQSVTAFRLEFPRRS